MRILAIDPGRVSGWYLTQDGSPISLTTREIKKGSHGQMLDAFSSLLDEHVVDVVIYEDPFVQNLRSARFQYAMTGLIHLFAYRVGAEIADPVNPSTLKKYATGHGHATKEQMILRASLYCELPINSDHEADAFWVHQFHLRKDAFEA